MTYEDAQWIVDLFAEPYLSTRHTETLQSQVARFVLNYDLETWDAEVVRERFSSFQFRLRIMDIRCRLSREAYTDEHTALRKELNDAVAAARQVLITATEDPRLQFTTPRG